MEMTVEQQPLIIVDEDLEDDWTKVAESHPFDLNAMDITEVDFAPCPVSPQDEFYPIGPLPASHGGLSRHQVVVSMAFGGKGGGYRQGQQGGSQQYQDLPRMGRNPDPGG